MANQLSEIASAIAAVASLGHGDRPEGMRLTETVAPPAAYVAFCRRLPAQCGDDIIEVLRAAGDVDATHQALRPSPSPAAAGPPPPSEPSVTNADQPRALTPRRWRQLVTINTRINRSLPPQVDMLTWGVDDYWILPSEVGAPGGDCEDYALEKRKALLEAGFPAASLNLAIVATPTGENHAVLLVSTREGEFVLDNLSSSIKPWKTTPYAWKVRQVNGQPFHWAQIG